MSQEYFTENSQVKIFYKDPEKTKPHSFNDLPAKIFSNGTKMWMKDGNLHRDGDLPAIEYADGSKEWYKDGKTHRDNNRPAVKHASGGVEYFYNGKRHRNDGPAIITQSKEKEYFLDGKFLNEDLFMTITGRKAAVDYEEFPDYSESANAPIPEDRTVKTLFLSSMEEGLRRNAVRYVTEAAIAACRALLLSASFSEKEKELLKIVLDSTLCEVIIKTAIGYNVEKFEKFAQNETIVSLARECRIQGMEDLQLEIFDNLMDHMVPAITDALVKVEKSASFKILEEKDNVSSIPEEAEEEKVEAKCAKI